MTTGHQDQGPNKLYWIRDNVFATDFPPVNRALRDPDGLLAIGGDLTMTRLLAAYQTGIFPWFNEDQPILWWSPNPRWVLLPEAIKISRSLAKTLRKERFTVTFNKAFEQVLENCAGAVRKGVGDTWITPEIRRAYLQLHAAGYAHSVECWHGLELVGGLYGVALGKVFFGESMFSRERDASKVALVSLTKKLTAKNFGLIDCQVHSKHLQTLGATPMQRQRFVQLLAVCCNSDRTSWG